MPVRLLASLVILCVLCAANGLAAPRKKKDKENREEVTQTLDIPKDPPAVITADASRLVFFVTPLSSRGLLSQQIRDAIRSLFSQAKGSQIVRIRAFVAGSADLRRVPSLVSELFTDKKLPLPAVSVVQVGALPLTGAQVQLEATGVAKQTEHPQGLAFVSGQPGQANDAPALLAKAFTDGNLKPESAVRITCFLDSLEGESVLRQGIASAFTRAVVSYVQLRRDSAGPFTECEAVASLQTRPATSPSISGSNDRYSQISRVGPVRLAFTGLQMAFGREEKDVRLALDRFSKTLESAGATWGTLVHINTYLLLSSVREKYREVRGTLINAKEPPASTTLVFEGLPSLDASFAVEAVAVIPK